MTRSSASGDPRDQDFSGRRTPAGGGGSGGHPLRSGGHSLRRRILEEAGIKPEPPEPPEIIATAAAVESSVEADGIATPLETEPDSGPDLDPPIAEAPDEAPRAAPSRAAPPPAAAAAATASAGGIDTLFVCLLKLTREFNRPVSEADVRGACPIPESGMRVEDFVRAADRLGYRVKRVPLDAEGCVGMPVPFVLLGSREHGAIAVLRRDRGRYTAFRALDGATAQTDAETLSGMGDEVLLVATKDEKARTRSTWRGMILTRLKSVFTELLIASIMINLFALASPLFMMTVYNKVIGQHAVNTLEVLAIGMLILYGFDFVLRAIRGYVSTHTGARLDALLGGEVVHRLVHLPYRHFETTSTGLISERLRQLDTIRGFFTGQMPLVLVDLAFVVIFLGTLLIVHPTMALIVTCAIPVFLLISTVFHRAQRKLVEENFHALAAKTSTLAETVANAVTVKSLGLESEIEKRWGERLARSAWAGFRTNNLANLINVFGQVLQQLAGLIIIVIGARLVIAGEMSIGALIASNILASRALAPMRQVVTAWSQLQEVRAAFRRIDDIMEEPTEIQAGELLPLTNFQGEIALENLSYTYEPDLPAVLKGVDLEIASGEVVCIMGPSGSGKSTIAKLLQGLYEPSGGRILIDRTDIRHMSPHSYRRQMGVVPQEIQLFATSVRENIALGAPASDPERVIAAAKFVGAHDFIQRLPRGYDTPLSERGGGLSVGQRQLICIARALMRNPQVLIMDEPTSALDSASEERVLRNLRRLKGNRTIIIISHRLAPAAIADRVALLSEGRIVSVGPPGEVARTMREQAEQRGAEAGKPAGNEEPAASGTKLSFGDQQPRGPGG